MGYYPPHTRASGILKRLHRLGRILRSPISPPGFGKIATAGATCYWVSDVTGNWFDQRNWSASSEGAGGFGIPSTTSDVIFDGGGTGKCIVDGPVTVADLTLTEGVAQVNANFDQNGQSITCDTLTYTCANNTSTLFDATLTLNNDLVIDGAVSAVPFAAANFVFPDGGDIETVVALPKITTAGQMAFTTAATVARLIATGQALEFLGGDEVFTLTAYTNATAAGADDGDWDDCTITSDDASTWDFVNPEGMVVSNVNVQDSNATNAIDATDGCTDGTGNTNWTFV
jgi:hypothetical protein